MDEPEKAHSDEARVRGNVSVIDRRWTDAFRQRPLRLGCGAAGSGPLSEQRGGGHECGRKQPGYPPCATSPLHGPSEVSILPCGESCGRVRNFGYVAGPCEEPRLRSAAPITALCGSRSQRTLARPMDRAISLESAHGVREPIGPGWRGQLASGRPTLSQQGGRGSFRASSEELIGRTESAHHRTSPSTGRVLPPACRGPAQR